MKEVLKMREKRIVLVNDVTGLSRCSVACQLPIISAMGIETAFVPTAILSINTYHKDFFFDDYTSKMNDYIETYKKIRHTIQEADQQALYLRQASILYGVFCNYPKTTSTLQVFLPASNGIRVPVTGCPSTVTDATPDSTCALLSIVIS